ncbi:DNA (cytosine-5)-methyltransferase 1 [Microbacterium sp. 1154]|uniref:DNA cytosine methyltransferase n=1 Tax=Microbacterium sp. 1154 TaxID=2817733 RepID=UPI00285A6EEF|nr:DNA cytosine methyltransferase [Microbacterium sp. 1154]MDR6689979.1 DNA (cytosine-5)-methyltransferase 1 [Microbacterium sp. 1154]
MDDLGLPVEQRGPTVIDLFSGAGGLSLGFEQAGFRIVAGTDYDPDAMATYARNFPNAIAVTGDIRNDSVKDRVFALGSDVDVIIGGPPCQAFSQVRNHSRLIDDPRNSLYREFVRVVDMVEPRAFVMENVPGMDQMGVREQVRSDLALGGKYIVSSTLLDAAEFGVPQTRKRLVFVGVHRDLGVAPPPIEGSGATAAVALMPDSVSHRGYRLGLRNDVVAEELLDRLRDPKDTSVVSVEQAIGDLNFLEAGNKQGALRSDALVRPASAYQRLMRNRRGVSNLEVPRMNVDTRLRLEGIPAGGNYRDLAEHLQRRYLTGQKWGPSNGTEMLSRKHYYAYRRLHPAFWAWTLNTKADAVYHYSEPRALSVREFCRLQSFPDAFEVTTDPRRGELEGRQPNGATHSRYRQIGNAVPPLLAAAVAGSLKRVLVNERSRIQV